MRTAGLFFLSMSLFVVAMTGDCKLQVDQRQESKDKCLYSSYKQLEGDKDDIGNGWQQEGEDCQHNATGEDVTKETESQRDHSADLLDDLQQADEKFDSTLETEFEQ